MAAGGVTEADTQRQPRFRLRRPGVAEKRVPNAIGGARHAMGESLPVGAQELPVTTSQRERPDKASAGAALSSSRRQEERVPQAQTALRPGGAAESLPSARQANFDHSGGRAGEAVPPAVQLAAGATLREAPAAARPPQLRRKNTVSESSAAGETTRPFRERAAREAPHGAEFQLEDYGSKVQGARSTRDEMVADAPSRPADRERAQIRRAEPHAQRPGLFRPIPVRASHDPAPAAPPRSVASYAHPEVPAERERTALGREEASGARTANASAASYGADTQVMDSTVMDTLGTGREESHSRRVATAQQVHGDKRLEDASLSVRPATRREGERPVMLLQQQQHQHESVFELPVVGQHGAFHLSATQRGAPAPRAAPQPAAGREEVWVQPSVLPDKTQREAGGSASHIADDQTFAPAVGTEHGARPGKGRGRENRVSGGDGGATAAAAGGAGEPLAPAAVHRPSRRQSEKTAGVAALDPLEGAGAPRKPHASLEDRTGPGLENAGANPQLSTTIHNTHASAFAPEVDARAERLHADREPALHGGREADPSRALETRGPNTNRVTAERVPAPGEDGTDRERAYAKNTAYNPRKPGARDEFSRIGSPVHTNTVTDRMIPESSARRRSKEGTAELDSQWLERARSPTAQRRHTEQQ